MSRLSTKEVVLTRPALDDEPALSHTFVLSSLPSFTALNLNKNLLALFGPSLSGLEGGLTLKGGFNVGKAAEAVSRTLGELSDENYNALFTKLFSTTVWLPEGVDAQELDTGANPVSLKDPKMLDRAFERDLEGLYRLAVIVMEYNRFPFFGRVVKVGRAILATLTSSDMTKSVSEKPQTSENSDPSTQT